MEDSKVMLLKLGVGGANLTKMHPAMQKVLKEVPLIWGDEEPIITSTWEGTHGRGSWHAFGRALDFRPPKKNVVMKLREKLGKDYDVVDEGNHIHIEFDPKE